MAELCSTRSLLVNSFATFQKEAPNYTAHEGLILLTEYKRLPMGVHLSKSVCNEIVIEA